MSPEETQLLKSLFDRVKTATSTPRDAEAENLINQAIREQPSAPYYLAQAVIVQEKGLEAAATHIRQLEERVHQLEASGADQQRSGQGGFLSSIFGSSQSHAPAPAPNPPPSYRNDTAGQTAGPWGRAPDAPQQQPSGPWTQQQPSAFSRMGGGGGGFLQGALGTAAGVAGGMLLANSLSGIFSNHMASSGWGSPFSGGNPLGNSLGNGPVEETVINNYYGDTAPQQNADDDNDDIQQADYDDSNDDTDFDSGDGDSFA